MKQYFKLLILLFALPAYAQEEDEYFDFPEEIKPYESQLVFETINADSAEKILRLDATKQIEEDDPEVVMYEYNDGEKVYLAIKEKGNWKSGFVSVMYSTLFGSGPEYSLVSLDNKGGKGVLVANYSNSSRGARYYNYDYRSCSNKLININTGNVYYLGQTYTDEASEYSGLVAVDTADEEKEMEEMDKKENWHSRYEAFEYTIQVTPGKVRFDDIECAGCEVEGLTSVFAIEYIWRDGKLIKDKVIPETK